MLASEDWPLPPFRRRHRSGLTLQRSADGRRFVSVAPGRLSRRRALFHVKHVARRGSASAPHLVGIARRSDGRNHTRVDRRCPSAAGWRVTARPRGRPARRLMSASSPDSAGPDNPPNLRPSGMASPLHLAGWTGRWEVPWSNRPTRFHVEHRSQPTMLAGRRSSRASPLSTRALLWPPRSRRMRGCASTSPGGDSRARLGPGS